jgi:replicative DNA helicase
MIHGQLFLSKVIDSADVGALKRFNITAADMPTEAERQALKFIADYAEQNRGQAPSYDTVVTEVPGFDYMPNVEANYEYMAKQIKANAAKTHLADFINGKFGNMYAEEKDGNKLLEDLLSEVERIKINTNISSVLGRTLDVIKDDFKSEYLKREEGKSFKRWDTPFESLTKEIGGWYSGDVYGIMGESGRGKSYLIAKVVDSLLRQGANVLWKSYEVKEFTSIARLVSIATAQDELLLDEIGRKVGIPNKQILSGKLDDVVRDHFLAIVETLDEYYGGTLYFQGKSGHELTRSLDDLERELMTGQVDAVILDPFYGLSDVYGKNVNKTAGGSAEYAATRFENIIGDNDVIGFYAVQATVEKKQTDEAGAREMKLPTRDQVKTSKRLLDIATNLLSFDSVAKEGIAMLGVEKGRNGGEDFTLELMALFDYGVLKEFPTGEAAASQFEF